MISVILTRLSHIEPGIIGMYIDGVLVWSSLPIWGTRSCLKWIRFEHQMLLYCYYISWSVSTIQYVLCELTRQIDCIMYLTKWLLKLSVRGYDAFTWWREEIVLNSASNIVTSETAFWNKRLSSSSLILFEELLVVHDTILDVSTSYDVPNARHRFAAPSTAKGHSCSLALKPRCSWWSFVVIWQLTLEAGNKY